MNNIFCWWRCHRNFVVVGALTLDTFSPRLIELMYEQKTWIGLDDKRNLNITILQIPFSLLLPVYKKVGCVHTFHIHIGIAQLLFQSCQRSKLHFHNQLYMIEIFLSFLCVSINHCWDIVVPIGGFSWLLKNTKATKHTRILVVFAKTILSVFPIIILS